MLIHRYPNTEIEILSSEVSRVDRTDPHRPRPALDIKFPVLTKKESRLKSGLVAGFGRLHKGLGRFRRGTKRRVQRLGGAIDEYASRHGLVRVFITLTCPGSSQRAMEQFSAWSGYLLNCLNLWLQRKQERFSGQTGLCRLHVWELQKRGAEHLHYCVCLSDRIASLVEKELRQWYFSVLTRISAFSSVDIFERSGSGGSWSERPDVLQIKVERVVKSVAGYMSKYLTKAMSSRVRGFASAIVPRPARLWGASRFLKRILSEFTTSVFWNLSSQDRSDCLCALQELATFEGFRLSVHSCHGGLTMRMRLFFSGNKSRCDEIFDSCVGIIESWPEKPLSKEREIPCMTALYRKAVRIHTNQKKKVPFNDFYGNEITGYLVNFANQVPQNKFITSMVMTCLEDFDEINLVSIQGLKKKREGQVRTMQTVIPLLFRPGTK